MECDICTKVLSRKQTLISHKVTHHGIQPDYQIKRYKMYMKDPTVKIPRSTAFRKCNSKAYAEKSFNNMQNVCDSKHFGTVNMSPSCGSLSDQDDRNTCTGSVETSCNLQNENCSNTDNEVNILQLEHYLDPNSTKTCQVRNVDMNETVQLQQQCSSLCIDSSNNETIVQPSTWDSDSSSVTTCRLFHSDSSNDASVYTGTSSDSDDSNIYTDTDSEKSSTSESEDEIDFDMFDQNNSKNTFPEDLSNEDEKSMALLAYMLRYHSSGNACRDLVKIINILNPKCKVKDINKLKEVVGSTDYQIIHFCEKCYTLFPDDEAVFQCSLIGCDGLRYKGPINKQSMKRRKSFFTCMSVCQQIKGILERDGIWSALSKYRSDCAATENITDILNADAYRELQKEGNFMQLNDNITLLFNTDGVPLFKSSGVSIWPVYLVINELPPSMRFSRRNMILWGIWQAKGKPVFRAFFQPFVEHMRQLKQDGLTIIVGAETIKTKVLLFASTMDLQAKAYLAETTQHNGKYGCITCEEPGEVVGQGRGHTRVYPFRPSTELYKERTTSEILMCGLAAVDTGKPELGIKGVSALHGLEWFDIVWGLVPDYMHGVLLGVGKMMLRLWFSSSSSGKPYFIGKSIKQVDRYLKRMKPTDDITRLPRKIEKNMHHFKASEIQMWLLFYAVPCLIEIMDPEYLEHFCYLVEGIYILLGDQISIERLKHAGHVLNIYYEKFSSLYGQNNCTLNLHNVCRHLPQYVKKLGPLWAWSCFAFEDMNGTVLESVHGTGDVCFQILWTIQAKKRLTVDSSKMKDPALKEFVEQCTNTRRTVQITKVASNCKIAGGMRKIILTDDMVKELKQLLNISVNDSLGLVSKVLRIVVDDKVLFSSSYTKIKKRICNIVLLSGNLPHSIIASVQYFLYHHTTNKCLAVVKHIKLKEDMALLNPIVSHLIAIETLDENDKDHIIPIENIKEKLIFLSGNASKTCVARLPNTYGLCS